MGVIYLIYDATTGQHNSKITVLINNSLSFELVGYDERCGETWK
jgi:hypothetical protein